MSKDASPADQAGSRAATPVLPPIGTPEPGETAEKPPKGEADAEQEYLNPNFQSGYTLRAARVIEKLNAIGIEAGALPLPGVTDPATCNREAERRQARKELVRRRQLLERYERNRDQMISIREELGCPEDPDEQDESDTMYSEDYVSGLRATMHTLRKDLRAADKERIAMTARIDNLEKLRDKADTQRRGAEERTVTMQKLVAQAEKRSKVFEQKERSFKQELNENKAEDRESELGKNLRESEQTILKQEAQLMGAGRRESILKTKVKALRHELSVEKDRMTRLMESPDRRKIEEKLERMRLEDEAAAKIQAQARGVKARKAADNAMRAATSIQAEYRRKKAAREMQARAKESIIKARECTARLGKVQAALTDLERTRDLVALDCEAAESKLNHAKEEMIEVTARLQETRLALTASLTLKGRSAAQGLLSRWKEVEAINAALAEAKLEEKAISDARIARQAEETVASIVKGEGGGGGGAEGEGAEGDKEGAEEDEEEYGEEDFE